MKLWRGDHIWALTIGRLCFCVHWVNGFTVALSFAERAQSWVGRTGYMMTKMKGTP